ncbi:MAG TPA: hypothetical protein VGZ00_12100 [Candidatus Baltobacteraceae bacterium]|nr:hypothetical protein [Candidatus Baltobacteraceae bacterium]
MDFPLGVKPELERRPWRSEGILGLLMDGTSIMRERLPVYVLLAAICALAALRGIPDLYRATENLALRTVAICAVAAVFFILPSALRKLDAHFRMTPKRILAMLATLAIIAAATEFGFAALIIPGIVLGVLLSQALIAILRADEDESKALPQMLSEAMFGSFSMTKNHFLSTLGMIVVSLIFLFVPLSVVLLATVLAANSHPWTFLFTMPVFLLTFIYLECVRYALIVHWYERLERAHESNTTAAAHS